MASTDDHRPENVRTSQPAIPATIEAKSLAPPIKEPTPPQQPAGPDVVTKPAPPARPLRRWLLLAVSALGLVIAGYFLVPTVVTMLNTVSTDDAYVNGHVTFVAPRVPGQVK